MSSDKSFSSEDHAIISFLIEYVFPVLDERNQIKWLRDTIGSYHNWNGLFSNERWHSDVIKQYHNTLMKEVCRRKKALAVIENADIEYVFSRKRMSADTLFIASRLNIPNFNTKQLAKACLSDNEKWEIDHRLRRMPSEFFSLFHSKDAMRMVHFFCVLYIFYKEMKVTEKIRESVTLYSFIDYVTLNKNETVVDQTPNEVL